MKKLNLFVLFLIVAAMFNGCQQSEFIDTETAGTGILKSASTFDLPLYMDQDILVGYAEITHGPDGHGILVNAFLPDLDPEWNVTCAHLYAGTDIPASASPGLFPFTDCDATDGISILIPEPEGWDHCTDLTWYYALHIGFMKEYIDPTTGATMTDTETAWLLPEEGGMTWKNKGKGSKDTGWGQYFQWKLNYSVELSDVDLLISQNLTDWNSVPGFSYCLDPAVEWYYFDATLTSSVDLAAENEFFLVPPVGNADFDAYWAAKLPQLALAGWADEMSAILAGTAPMFYLTWDGTDYELIDGFQRAIGHGDNPLRINGDYPEGTYEFTADVAGEFCTKEDFSISLTVGGCNQLDYSKS